eukprot:COSAG06_NODE_3964_length_4715_cov_7.644578_2_plen_106_part_00
MVGGAATTVGLCCISSVCSSCGFSSTASIHVNLGAVGSAPVPEVVTVVVVVVIPVAVVVATVGMSLCVGNLSRAASFAPPSMAATDTVGSSRDVNDVQQFSVSTQ